MLNLPNLRRVGGIAIALALTGCSPSTALPSGPSASGPSPSSAPVQSTRPAPSTAAPSATANSIPPSAAADGSTPTPSPTVLVPPSEAGGLGRDTLAIVATDGLRVRSLPTVAGQSERLVPLLPVGTKLYVVGGAVAADGYSWYQVMPYGERQLLPFGWVASASRAGEPWVEALPLGCDTIASTPESLVSGEPLEHLFCSLAGDTPRRSPPGPDIRIVGDLRCTVADDHWGPLYGPDWIDQRGYCELRTDVGSMRLVGEPLMELLGGLSNPVEGRYAVVGHFDDAGARDCREGALEGLVPAPPAAVVLRCRTFFVVTETTPVRSP